MFACLMYHRVVEEPTSRFDVRTADFRQHLDALAEEGFTAEGFAGLRSRLELDERFPQRYVVLSFDDGHSSAQLAAQELANHGFAATFAIVSGWIGQDSMLTASEIARISGEHDIASHTHSHANLERMPLDELRDELATSKRELEEVTGVRCSSLCLPGGSGGRRAVQLARELGYDLVGTSRPSFNNRDLVRRKSTVNRICVYRTTGTLDLIRTAACQGSVVRRELFYHSAVTAVRRLLTEEQFVRARRRFGRD